jgi:calpain-7
VKCEVSSLDGTLSILASYDGAFEDVGFTISVYSTVAVSWDERIPKGPFTSKVNRVECKKKFSRIQRQVDGTLTVKNAGGNYTYPTFMVNPQYHLHIHAERQTGPQSSLRAKVELILQGHREIPLNMIVVWSQGERIFE